MKITKIFARQILDSRGNPTIETDITLDDGSFGRAAVPSGASTGTHEALELRDGDKNFYNGLGVLKAIENVNTKISEKIIGLEINSQEELDNILINLDGTENKNVLGANAILSVSISFLKATAASKNLPLFQYVKEISGNTSEVSLPTPMVNVINGGKHAAGSTDIQEFMIVPMTGKTIAEKIQMSTEVFHSLGKVLKSKGYQTAVGDEGGYAPKFTNGNTEALDLISEAVKATKYELGKDICFVLDVAATEMLDGEMYNLKTENKKLTEDEMINWYAELIQKYPIVSIEDGLGENSWEGWKKLNQMLGEKIKLVGDDLFVTNTKFLQRGIDEKSANSILVKINQIGTITETVNTVNLAKANNFATIISHRSGETEDTTIAHLAVGLSAPFIKTGSMSRSERVAKYNELMRIEEIL